MVTTILFRVIRVVNLRPICASILPEGSGEKYFKEKRNRYFDILI